MIVRLLGAVVTVCSVAALVLHDFSLRTTATRPSWLGLVDTFAIALYLPVLVAFLLAVIARSRIGVLAALIGLMIFANDYGTRFLPRQIDPPRSGESIIVLTNNLLANNTESAQVAKVIGEEDPDVILLQELSEEMAVGLQRELGDRYPHQVLSPAWTDGIGVFSRLPIVSAERLGLSEEGYPALVVRVQLGDQTVTLFNVHLHGPEVRWYRRWPMPVGVPIDYDSAIRDREIEELLRHVDSAPDPVIVAGDFNLPERSPSYKRTAQRLQDAYVVAGYGFGHTFPRIRYPFPGHRSIVRQVGNLGPLLRIDYVWHDERLRTVRAHVGPSTGSDHLPVIAELNLPSSTDVDHAAAAR